MYYKDYVTSIVLIKRGDMYIVFQTIFEVHLHGPYQSSPILHTDSNLFSCSNLFNLPSLHTSANKTELNKQKIKNKSLTHKQKTVDLQQ